MGDACAFLVTYAMPKQLQIPMSGMTFNAPHHPYHGGEECSAKKLTVEF